MIDISVGAKTPGTVPETSERYQINLSEGKINPSVTKSVGPVENVGVEGSIYLADPRLRTH